MKNILFLLVSLVGLSALAASGAGGHGWDEHTKHTVMYQCINVSILVGGLIYFLRKPTKEFFSSRKAQFVEASEKAHAARKAAEDEHMNIQVRLNQLEGTASESVARARAEAADMKTQLISEAKTLSTKIREEAANAAKNEVERAKHQLRVQLIKESTDLARGQMSSKVSTEDHQRLQGEFINNIRGVQA